MVYDDHDFCPMSIDHIIVGILIGYKADNGFIYSSHGPPSEDPDIKTVLLFVVHLTCIELVDRVM